MKYAFLIVAGLSVICLFSFYPVDKQPFVLNDIPAAQHKAANQGKLLLVQFTARWCAPCQMMEQNTWTHPDLMNYMSDNCVAAKVDIENFDGMSYTQQYKIKNVPTLLVFSADGRLVGRYENSISASHLIKYLEQFNISENRVSNHAVATTAAQDKMSPTLSGILEEYAMQKAEAEAGTWVNGEAALIQEKSALPIEPIPHSTTGSSWDVPAIIVEEVGSQTSDYAAAETAQSRFIAPVSTSANYKPTEPVVITPPVASNQLLYTVQLGAYKSKQSASRILSQQAKILGREVWMIEPDELHDAYYRIITGTFYNREQATAYVANIKAEGLDGFVRILPEQSSAYLSLSMR